MAKIFKHLGFGQKKQPPIPPRPDYEGNKVSKQSQGVSFKFSSQSASRPTTLNIISNQSTKEIVVQEDYSDPADLRAELKAEALDDYYSNPYEISAALLLKDPQETPRAEVVDYEDPPAYDLPAELDDSSSVYDLPAEDEAVAYDEPWEWTSRLASSLQVSPSYSHLLNSLGSSRDELDATGTHSPSSEAPTSDPECEDEAMAVRQRHVYETAFDSLVKRDMDDIDRLPQCTVLQDDMFRPTASPRPLRTSSAANTPTHQSKFAPVRESPRISRAGKMGSRRSITVDGLGRHADPRNSENESPLLGKKNSLSDAFKHLARPRNRISPVSGSSSRDSPAHKQQILTLDTNIVYKDSEVYNAPENLDGRIKHGPEFPLPSAPPPVLENTHQSPHTDLRPTDEYDAPWELLKGDSPPDFRALNKSDDLLGGKNEPQCSERKSQVPSSASSSTSSPIPSSSSTDSNASSPSLPSSTCDQPVTTSTTPPASSPPKPSGPPPRPSLNLNLNATPKKPRQGLSLNFGCAALSVLGEKIDPTISLEKQGWYHGSISRLDAENLLRVLKEGSYLVRNSESAKQDYSLSLKSARGFMHMKIVQQEGRFILGQFSKPFPSIPEMIHHYSLNKLPIKGAEHMSLLHPVIDQLL